MSADLSTSHVVTTRRHASRRGPRGRRDVQPARQGPEQWFDSERYHVHGRGARRMYSTRDRPARRALASIAAIRSSGMSRIRMSAIQLLGGITSTNPRPGSYSRAQPADFVSSPDGRRRQRSPKPKPYSHLIDSASSTQIHRSNGPDSASPASSPAPDADRPRRRRSHCLPTHTSQPITAPNRLPLSDTADDSRVFNRVSNPSRPSSSGDRATAS